MVALDQDELHTLQAAKSANPWYFNALVLAAAVVPQRVHKYSPGDNQFVNFETAARLMGKTVSECFRWYQALKFARLLESDEDAEDESLADTLGDLAYYALLERGWRDKQAEEVEDRNPKDIPCPRCGIGMKPGWLLEDHIRGFHGQNVEED